MEKNKLQIFGAMLQDLGMNTMGVPGSALERHLRRQEMQEQEEINRAIQIGMLDKLGMLGELGMQPGAPGVTPNIPNITPQEPPPEKLAPYTQGQSDFGQINLRGMPQRMGVTGANVGGLNIGLTPEYKDFLDVRKSLQQKYGEAKTEIDKAKLTSMYNLSLIAENMYDYSRVLAESYKEGGAGNRAKAFRATLAREGLLPEEEAEKYKSSAAVFGKRLEIVGKMFPMLTQQIGKEGSVRLIRSIFDRVGKTLPDLHTAPKLAKSEMKATIESMYRVRRAMENMNLADFNLDTKKGQDDFVKKVAGMTNKIELTGKEKQELKRLINKATEPLSDYIKERDNKGFKKTKGGIKYRVLGD